MTRPLRVLSLAAPLLAATPALAQLSGTGTLVCTPVDDGLYHNAATIQNTGTTTIGTFWFAWAPGEDYLPRRPVFALGPIGWFGTVVQTGSSYSVEWFAWDPDARIQPGQSLPGFEFVGPDGPEVLTGPSPAFPSHHCNESYLYTGGPQDDPGYRFSVTIVPGSACGTADFNGDGDFGTDQDIEAFFACLSGACCAGCWHNGADFNGDGDFGTDQDIESFFRVLSGGSC
jgi:hypothetical protein